MRRLALIAALVLGGVASLAGSAMGEDEHLYYLEFDNAFGLVDGSEVKVAGVPQGVIEELFINSDKRAVARVRLSGPLAVLGEETICSSEPQSLIAEYFIDCVPKGAELAEGEGSETERVEAPDIPVAQTRQTVQNDLVQSGLRQSYKERLSLIINEFGTALAGNPENLNAAIRRGAPALRAARRVTRVLGDQNRIIRNLNVDSDRIMGRLADRRKDVVSFIENAKRTAEVGAARRDDLSANFRDLDDFLAELGPTMAELNELAVTQTPLLRDLRASAGGLNTLSRDLPSFNSAAAKSLVTLGDAAAVGRRALRKGSDEIEQLKESSRKAFPVADQLQSFLRDVDDPGRAVETDARAARDTGRDAPTGYTGLEGLLNYVYYQTGALSQYDEISHLLHFSIFEVGTGPCAEYNAGDSVPAAGGGTTTDILEADPCVAWLGPNQPGISQSVKEEPYPASVCPDGSADHSICDPAGTTSAPAASRGSRSGGGERGAGSKGPGGTGDGEGGSPGGGDDAPAVPVVPEGLPGAGDDVPNGLPGALDEILGLGKGAGGKRAGKGRRGKDKAGKGKSGLPALPKLRRGGDRGTGDLLGYLLDD